MDTSFGRRTPRARSGPNREDRAPLMALPGGHLRPQAATKQALVGEVLLLANRRPGPNAQAADLQVWGDALRERSHRSRAWCRLTAAVGAAYSHAWPTGVGRRRLQTGGSLLAPGLIRGLSIWPAHALRCKCSSRRWRSARLWTRSATLIWPPSSCRSRTLWRRCSLARPLSWLGRTSRTLRPPKRRLSPLWKLNFWVIDNSRTLPGAIN